MIPFHSFVFTFSFQIYQGNLSQSITSRVRIEISVSQMNSTFQGLNVNIQTSEDL